LERGDYYNAAESHALTVFGFGGCIILQGRVPKKSARGQNRVRMSFGKLWKVVD